jgi:hypothetical protein
MLVASALFQGKSSASGVAYVLEYSFGAQLSNEQLTVQRFQRWSNHIRELSRVREPYSRG